MNQPICKPDDHNFVESQILSARQSGYLVLFCSKCGYAVRLSADAVVKL